MTRVTREQVEDILISLPVGKPDRQTIEDICRDWLDMQERERRLVAVVEAFKAEYPREMAEVFAAYAEEWGTDDGD
jgi:hypothetical protein